MKIFVYGTLLSGEGDHRQLRGARPLAVRRTEPLYTLVSLGPYPALLDGGTTSVTGEVYDVDGDLLSALDRFEGVPRLYRRARDPAARRRVCRRLPAGAPAPQELSGHRQRRLEGVPMRIEVVGDGHVFQGTPQQILMQMKSLAFGAEHMSMREYIEGNVANIARGFGITFKLTGETDEELAESFLQQMLDGGYARKL